MLSLLTLYDDMGRIHVHKQVVLDQTTTFMITVNRIGKCFQHNRLLLVVITYHDKIRSLTDSNCLARVLHSKKRNFCCIIF